MTCHTVAIACQGGGTHASFTWGVLDKILKTKPKWDVEGRDDTFDITALSGTSGGALVALMVWYGLAPKTTMQGGGNTYADAAKTLDDFYEGFAATEPAEILHNFISVLTLKMKEKGVLIPGINPYEHFDDWLLAQFGLLGARPQYLGWEELLAWACPDYGAVDWPNVTVRAIVGASEVISGAETVFDTRMNQEQMGLKAPLAPTHQWRRREPFSLKGVQASGTLPSIVEATKVDGGIYYDGLYSQNPPIRPLMSGIPLAEIPEEIWVVRINPQNIKDEPKDPETIKDRENELMGNLSLNKELDFIQVVNKWVNDYAGTPFAANKRHVTVRTIKMSEDTALKLRWPTKMDRDFGHMQVLREEGKTVAESWLNNWPQNTGTYPDDVGY